MSKICIHRASLHESNAIANELNCCRRKVFDCILIGDEFNLGNFKDAHCVHHFSINIAHYFPSKLKHRRRGRRCRHRNNKNSNLNRIGSQRQKGESKCSNRTHVLFIVASATRILNKQQISSIHALFCLLFLLCCSMVNISWCSFGFRLKITNKKIYS